MRSYYNIIHRLPLFLFALLVCVNIPAQDLSVKKPKLYESWTTLKDKPAKLRGLLYEIKDSSVVYADTRSGFDIQSGRFRKAEIPAANIDVLKVRRTESVKRGASIGGSILGLGFLIIGIAEKDNFGEFAALIIPETTIIGAAAGAVVGAAIGSFRDIIVIKGNIDNFNSNRSRLQHYSYLIEYPPAVLLNPVEHKSYIGIVMGPSFPLGEFGDKSSANQDAGFAKTGDFGSVINIGYRISEDFGISVNLFDNQYDVGKENSLDWWNVGGWMFGPMYTVNLNRKLLFDIKPRIGYVAAQLQRDTEIIDNGRGLGVNLSVSLQYNITKRISVLAETGYLTSMLRFSSRERKGLSFYDLGIGAAYRFR